MKLHPALLLLLAFCLPCLTARAAVRLPSMFGNGMVLQRQAPAPVWGWADPGERVTVSFRRQRVSATAGADGRWRVTLQPLRAGGPYTMTVKGKNTVTFTDVLVGEVWICSGQSNMAIALTSAKNAEQEIAAANYPQIRLFSTAYSTRQVPTDEVTGCWQACTPDSARSFSAVAYFFGRKLYREMGVPVGLVNAAVGSSAAEAWTSRTALESDARMRDAVAIMDKELPKYPAPLNDTGWEAPEFADATWGEMALPQPWENAGVGLATHDGAVWFRKVINIPAAWAGKVLALHFGPIDDGDLTYFNGVRVGSMDLRNPDVWKTPRSYTVPGTLVKPGRAVLALRITDVMGQGGVLGTADEMSLAPADGTAPAISLAGAWKFKPSAWWPTFFTPTTLYNGMIAPWTTYAMRGAIWYQGESNTDNAVRYQAMLSAMIRGWRAAWHEDDFAFLIVQLPNFMAEQPAPSDGLWAKFREAQYLITKTLPHTGLAVTIDIGETNNIHPANKQDVGDRLGRLALGDIYGKKTPTMGPVFASMTVEGTSIRLRFTHTDGGLLVKGGGPLQGFAIAGADRQFVWATATIDGDSILVHSDAIATPAAVRYAWADNPRCNLYNTAGLPAMPFRTDG